MTLLPDMFVLPGRTLTGAGVAASLVSECAVFGRRGLIVHGRSLRNSGALATVLERAPASFPVLSWEHSGGEPDLAQLVELLKAARSHQAEWIAGVGGGSVMDLAKSCAGLFHASRGPSVYHDGAEVESEGIPFAAVPTTAGTGSEATINAVLTNSITGQKKSIRGSRLIARLVILDPQLLSQCPKQVIACSGMDAFTQAIEAYVSRKATWLSDGLALKALTLIAGNLELVYGGGTPETRMQLLIGSYFAGLALSMARLGVVHGLAHPLGVRYHLPHGLICAVCLPHAIELNRDAMGEKYGRMSQALRGDLLIRALVLLQRLGIESPLKGRPVVDKDLIIQEALASGSTAANPKQVSASDIEFLLNRVF